VVASRTSRRRRPAADGLPRSRQPAGRSPRARPPGCRRSHSGRRRLRGRGGSPSPHQAAERQPSALAKIGGDRSFKSGTGSTGCQRSSSGSTHADRIHDRTLATRRSALFATLR
jgi:hypothetical protein